MALLGVDGQAADLLDLLEHDGVRLLWHPSLSLDPLAPIVRQVLDEVLPLTDRQREIVKLIGLGLSNRDVAAQLTISVRTVEGHIHNAMAKTGTSSREDLAALLPRGTSKSPD
jgi:DNA-binding CsgD family transcriptional regulator